MYQNSLLIQIHDQALPAAKASWAAYQQGKFWPYHDAFFTNKQQLGETFYLDIAKNLNLDLAKFKLDVDLANKAIQKDLQLVYKLGLSNTPYFIINSKIFLHSSSAFRN